MNIYSDINQLTRNVTEIFGEKGKNWIANLPQTTEALCKYWKLANFEPVNNLTFNYIVKAFVRTNPVIVKIICDEKSYREEQAAIDYFQRMGCARFIDSNDTHHALLLERAIPGMSLKSLYPAEAEFVISVYAATASKLHHKALASAEHLLHIREWLQSIDRVAPGFIPEPLLEKAKQLKHSLLTSANSEVFLHGDLHLDNVLQHGSEWIVIDPKGIVGEPEFEIVAFDFIHQKEMRSPDEVKLILEDRVRLLAQKTALSAQRIKD